MLLHSMCMFFLFMHIITMHIQHTIHIILRNICPQVHISLICAIRPSVVEKEVRKRKSLEVIKNRDKFATFNVSSYSGDIQHAFCY